MNKAFIACSAFRGNDIINLLKLFRDSLQDLYRRLYDIDAEARDVPKDYYLAISDALETTSDNHTVKLATHHLLRLFGFLKIVKIGFIQSPNACMKLPGIQIP